MGKVSQITELRNIRRKFHSESFRNEQHILYIDSFREKVLQLNGHLRKLQNFSTSKLFYIYDSYSISQG